MGLRLEPRLQEEVQQGMEYQTPGSFGEAFSAGFDSSVFKKATSQIAQFHGGMEAQEISLRLGKGDKLSPDTLFNETGFRPDTSMTIGEAMYYAELKKDQEDADARVERHSDTLLNKIGSTVGGIVGSLDPIETGLGMMAGGLGGNIALRAGYGMAQGLAVEAGLDFATNLAIEEAAGWGQKQIGQEYTMADKLFNATVGTLFSTALSASASKIGKMYDKFGAQKIERIKQNVLKEALEKGNDPTRALDALDNDMLKQTSIHESLDAGFRKTLGDERTDELFSGAEDVFDLQERIKMEIQEGRMSPDDLLSLEKNLEEAGYENFGLFREQPEFDASVETRQAVKEAMTEKVDTPEVTRAGDTVEEVKPFGDVKEEVRITDLKKHNDQLDSEIEDIFADVKGKEKLEDVFEKAELDEYKAIKQEETELDAEVEHDKLFRQCLGGA